MAKRSDAKTARVRAYLEDNPQATTAAVCKALKRYGVNSKDVANARRGQRQAAQRAAQAVAPGKAAPGMAIEICLPDGGVTLKLKNGKGMIGTFTFTEAGMRYARPNAKRRPDRDVPYTVVEQLMDLGVVARNG